MDKKILLINDMPGYGKVALPAMVPILTHMKYEVFSLPTALVSNTLDYGKFAILETTDYMKQAIGVWKQLGFSFSAIVTGFIFSRAQADVVAALCKEQKQHGVQVFMDPIMGDEGRLYNGVGEETITYLRDLAGLADYIMPNYTEAAFLAGMPCRHDSISEDEARQLMDALRQVCPKSILITSVHTEGSYAVLGYDHSRNTYFQLPYTHIPVRFPGTGDIFSAILAGQVLQGHDLEAAAFSAMQSVGSLITANQDTTNVIPGIPVEQCLNLVQEISNI